MVSQTVNAVISPDGFVSIEYLIPLNIIVSEVPFVYSGDDNTFPVLNVYNTTPIAIDVE